MFYTIFDVLHCVSIIVLPIIRHNLIKHIIKSTSDIQNTNVLHERSLNHMYHQYGCRYYTLFIITVIMRSAF